MCKIIYEADKRNRENKGFQSLDIFEYSDECYSYSEKYKKYMPYDDIDEGRITNQCDYFSINKAKRIINRSDVPKGTKFYLWHRYKGKNVIIYK